MRRSHNLKILVFALLTSIFFFGVEANAAWQEEWERTVKAAKQEGQLRIWGGEEVSHPTIITAFPFHLLTTSQRVLNCSGFLSSFVL